MKFWEYMAIWASLALGNLLYVGISNNGTLFSAFERSYFQLFPVLLLWWCRECKWSWLD